MNKKILHSVIFALLIAGLSSCSSQYQLVNAKRTKQDSNIQVAKANNKKVIAPVTETAVDVTVNNATTTVNPVAENCSYATIPQNRNVTVVQPIQTKQPEKVFARETIVSPKSVTVTKENPVATESKATKPTKHVLKHDGANQLLSAIIAIFIPPLGVALYEGAITMNFWIDLILTLLFYLPGLIYALIVILA